MINIQTAELLVGLITFFLAYMVAVTIAGAFRAWMAARAGDTTAEDIGFLTLNPLAHVDPVGLLFLFLPRFYFGWGRHVPINPFNITPPRRNLKLVSVFFSDAISHFILALLGITTLVALFGESIIDFAREMIRHRAMSHLHIAHAFPEYSSLVVSLGFILIAFVYLNVILGVLNVIVNGSNLCIYLLVERSPRYSKYNYYVIILVPILLILFFLEPLRFLAINVITSVGYFLARALRMI